jgi:hypothetical protein
MQIMSNALWDRCVYVSSFYSNAVMKCVNVRCMYMLIYYYNRDEPGLVECPLVAVGGTVGSMHAS